MGQIRVRTTGGFCISEPDGAKMDQTPVQVEGTIFIRAKIAEGLLEEVPVGEFLTEARKKAKDEQNKMMMVAENKSV